MFRHKYPTLYRYLSLFTLNNGLDIQQIRGIVSNAIDSNIILVKEIKSAFSDDSIIWRDVLDDPDLGEIYPTDSESEARNYARQMFLVTAP